MEDSPDFRLLTSADIDAAAKVISWAFIDDPLCTFMLPWRETRVKTLNKFFRAYGEVNIKNLRGYGSGEPLQGVAYWKFPDQDSLSISIKAIGNFLPLLFTWYPIGYFRARAILAQTDALYTKYTNEPHFYLDNLGVLESARGNGIASKLIRPILEQADARKVIVYTDTVTRRNVGLYEHYGFQCMEEAAVPGTGITVFAMRRPIQP